MGVDRTSFIGLEYTADELVNFNLNRLDRVLQVKIGATTVPTSTPVVAAFRPVSSEVMNRNLDRLDRYWYAAGFTAIPAAGLPPTALGLQGRTSLLGLYLTGHGMDHNWHRCDSIAQNLSIAAQPQAAEEPEPSHVTAEGANGGAET